MTLTVRRQVLFDWLQTEVRRVTNNNSFKVILAEQSEQRPKPPYASLKLINPSGRIGGMDEIGTNARNLEVKMNRRTVASVHVIGRNATDILSSVRDTLDRPDVVDAFRAAGMVHVSESDVRDLTALLETTSEERAQMDITLTYTKTDTVDVSTIEVVSIEGTIDSGSNEFEMEASVGEI